MLFVDGHLPQNAMKVRKKQRTPGYVLLCTLVWIKNGIAIFTKE